MFGYAVANTKTQRGGSTLRHDRHLLYNAVATTTKSQFSRRPSTAASCYLTKKPPFVFGYAVANRESQRRGPTLHHDRHLLYNVVATTTKSRFSRRSNTAASCCLTGTPTFVFGYATANTQAQHKGNAGARLPRAACAAHNRATRIGLRRRRSQRAQMVSKWCPNDVQIMSK